MVLVPPGTIPHSTALPIHHPTPYSLVLVPPYYPSPYPPPTPHPHHTPYSVTWTSHTCIVERQIQNKTDAKVKHKLSNYENKFTICLNLVQSSYHHIGAIASDWQNARDTVQ